MMTKEDIIKLAREAGWISEYDSPTGFCAEAAFKFAALVATAVAEPVQEPVAWANSFDLKNFDMKVRTCPDLHHTVPLYAAPPKRELHESREAAVRAEREEIARSLDKQADLAGDPMDRKWAQQMAAAVRARSNT